MIKEIFSRPLFWPNFRCLGAGGKTAIDNPDRRGGAAVCFRQVARAEALFAPRFFAIYTGVFFSRYARLRHAKDADN
jgi:hypothetical protein